MKHILVAGGAGFIGSHLCDELCRQGHEVRVWDNGITGSMDNLHLLIAEKKLIYQKIDITQSSQMRFDGPLDEIYNLASPASPKDFRNMPLQILQVNSVGLKNLLDLSLQKSARLLYCSSSEVYGDALVHPQNEEYHGNVNTVGERSCYDEAKRFGEALIFAYKREFQANCGIARIFNTYGPRMRWNDGRVIPNFFKQALEATPLTIYGDGTQTRSFCYVTDMVRGLIALMESSQTGPINLGNPQEIQVKELAKMILSLTKASSGIEFKPLPQDDPKQRCPTITKAHELLRWWPQIELNEGLTRVSEHLRNVRP
jgi:dTDP-glucose 4,6-dehydratase